MAKRMKDTQYYLLTLKGDGLKADLSKDIAAELDCDFLNGDKVYTISVKKITPEFRLKEEK